MSAFFRKIIGKFSNTSMSQTVNTSNQEEEPVVRPLPPRRSARLLIKRERARRQAEEELKRRLEVQLVERLDEQLMQQRQSKFVRRMSQRMEQETELQLLPSPNMPKPRQKRKRIRDKHQELNGDHDDHNWNENQNPDQDQEQSRVEGNRCVCAEIDGEYYKLYDLPDKAEHIVREVPRTL